MRHHVNPVRPRIVALAATLPVLMLTAGLALADSGRIRALAVQYRPQVQYRGSGGQTYRPQVTYQPRGGGRYQPQVRYRGDAGYRGGYSGGTTRYRPDGHYYGGGGGGYGYYRPSYGYRRYPRYYYPRSRSYVSFGFGFGGGYPYYPYYPRTRVVHVVHPVRTLVIADLPPDGCTYYDPYCDETFSSLSDYRQHLDDVDHDSMIEVLDDDGDCVGSYGYVEGRWSIVN